MRGAKIRFIITMLLFGSIGLFVKYIPFTSAQIACTRGIIGSLFLLLVGGGIRHEFSPRRIKKNLKVLLLSGIAIGINWILLFESYRYTSVSNATICYYFAPVFVVFLSPLVLKEKLRKEHVASIGLAMAGMFFIMGNGISQNGKNDLLGIALGIGAAAFYAIVMLSNKFLHELSGMESSFVQLFLAAVAILPYVGLEWGKTSVEVTAETLCLLAIVGVVHTGIAYYLYFTSMQKLKAQTIATYSYIDPIAAILLSAVVLGERVTLPQGVGAVLVLGATFYNEYASIQAKA